MPPIAAWRWKQPIVYSGADRDLFAELIYVKQRYILADGEATRAKTVSGAFRILPGSGHLIISIDGDDPRRVRVSGF